MRLVRWVHGMRYSLVWAVLAMGFLVFAGYALGNERMFRPVEGGGGTHPLTLFCVYLLAAAVSTYRPLRRLTFVARLFAGLVVVICLARFAEVLIAGNDMPFSDLFLLPGVPVDPDNPIRMGANTAWVALAVALGLLLRRELPRSGFFFASAAPFLPLMSLIGYSDGVNRFHGAMSPISALMLLVLAVAVLSTYAHLASVRVLMRDDLPGRLVRYQIMAITVFFGACAFLLPRVGADYGAIFATVTIWFSIAMVTYTSQLHEKSDLRRRLVERRLKWESVTDPLTGLTNRRAATALGQNLFAQACRTGEAMSALMMDLDHFKRVNDTYGHAEGDRVLRDVAEVLRTRLRRTDVLSRWGGEEFLLLLPGAGEVEAHGVAEELRRLVAARVKPPAGPVHLPITASIGVAGQSTSDEDLNELIQRADAALYAAKDQGRDRVVGCHQLVELQTGAPCPHASPEGRGNPGPGFGASPCGDCPLHGCASRMVTETFMIPKAKPA